MMILSSGPICDPPLLAPRRTTCSRVLKTAHSALQRRNLRHTVRPVVAPRPIAVGSSAPSPECLPPAGIYQKAVDLGAAKAAYPAWKSFLGGVMGGAFISFGMALALSVGGAVPGIAAANPGLQKILLGAFGLPFGLLMVVATGAELFTGNTALVSAAFFEGRASGRALATNWAASYLGNAVGSALLVALMVGAGTFAAAATPLAVAQAKTALTFGQAFVRGLLCNWLVCMAVWQATATSSFFGKALACLLPVSAFVALSLEHSVANMFAVPLGICLGAGVSWQSFFTANLIPVTLGNIAGGAVCVAAAYSFMFGSGWHGPAK